MNSLTRSDLIQEVLINMNVTEIAYTTKVSVSSVGNSGHFPHQLQLDLLSVNRLIQKANLTYKTMYGLPP